MDKIVGLLRRIIDRSDPPPAEPAGPRIQEREQAAAKDRLLEQARRRAAEHRYDRRAG
ncbi:hypothetical protein AB0C50_16765 [Micromonospora taraxaci]|uniref:hypothetical protein n=1 Tax=Micromonospora taraxaci TaxID=1316803 RepID=UPI0033D3213D